MVDEDLSIKVDESGVIRIGVFPTKSGFTTSSHAYDDDRFIFLLLFYHMI